MFKSETEDMLPRSAPTPISSHVPNAAPSVPEVSIVFGENHSKTSFCKEIDSNTTTTYAAWKQQVLPKVIYPTRLEKIRNKDNIIRGVKKSDMLTLTSMDLKPEDLYCSNSHQNDNTQSVENSSDPVYTIEPNEIVTNSAETQTDQTNHFYPMSTCSVSFSLEQLLSIVQEIKNEQKHLTDMCQLLLKNQQQIQYCLTKERIFKSDELLCDKALNNDSNANLNSAALCKVESEIVQCDDKILEHSSNEKSYNHSKQISKTLETPALLSNESEVPHSAIISNSSLNFLQKATNEKNATDKVMHELAFKYLPSDKLTDLIHDVHINTPPRLQFIPQVLNAPDVEKSPNDFSNASYKYLKKYRLLPEDNEHYLKHNLNKTSYDSKGYTPYQYIYSPIVPETEHKKNIKKLVVDLENIKNQPKFF